jgi:hypothetical protein
MKTDTTPIATSHPAPAIVRLQPQTLEAVIAPQGIIKTGPVSLTGTFTGSLGLIGTCTVR